MNRNILQVVLKKHNSLVNKFFKKANKLNELESKKV